MINDIPIHPEEGRDAVSTSAGSPCLHPLDGNLHKRPGLLIYKKDGPLRSPFHRRACGRKWNGIALGLRRIGVIPGDKVVLPGRKRPLVGDD